jgi:hypothetical protein
MKTLMLVVLASLLSVNAHAAELVKSEKTQTSIARVVSVTNLSPKESVKATLAVEDLGGSTDMSPTQVIHFNLYQKGEMFSTDASFNLGAIWNFESARKVEPGIYVVAVNILDESSKIVKQTIWIDARKAIKDIKSVTCEDFDCESSNNFQSKISVVRK